MGSRLKIALLAGLIAVGSAAAAQEAEDTSRWRFLSSMGPAVILVADTVEGVSTVRRVTTFTSLREPHASGVDGILTEFEVDCRGETIKDLGSTAFAGTEERGRVPSQTQDAAARYQPGTYFGDVAAYACFRRVASRDRRVVTGRLAAVEYARQRAR